MAGLAIPNGSYTDPMCPARPLLVFGRSLCSILTLKVSCAMCHSSPSEVLSSEVELGLSSYRFITSGSGSVGGNAFRTDSALD